MLKRISVLLIVFVLMSCGAKPIKPIVDMKKFEDMNYPCIRIDFPDQLRYSDMVMYKTDENLALVYKLTTPNYLIDIVKFYGIIDDINWSYESLGELNSHSTTIYKKSDKEDGNARSAIITVFERDGELFLRGAVGEFISKDRAFRVDIIRRIKTLGAFRKDVFENWSSSTTGRKTIDNMQKIVDFIYNSSNVTDCKIRGNIDMDWWKK